MTKHPWPQPSLSTRREVVHLIEVGRPNEGAEILHRFYETPYPLKVFTPRQALESMYPCIEAELPAWSYVFSFGEWEKLKEEFPSDYEKFWSHYGPEGLDVIDVTRGTKIGWFIPSPGDDCPDIILVSEAYVHHPAVTLHEFRHLLHHHLKLPPFPDTARITLPETWDKWTVDFLTGVKPKPWFPWDALIPALFILTFISIPILWWSHFFYSSHVR